MKKLFQISICLSLLTLLAYTPEKPKSIINNSKVNEDTLLIDSIDIKILQISKMDSVLSKKMKDIKQDNKTINQQIIKIKKLNVEIKDSIVVDSVPVKTKKKSFIKKLIDGLKN